MGKKKNKTINTAMWAIQNPGKAKEMEERFGVTARKYPGRKGDSYESPEDYRASSNWHEDMTEAARKDYDFRRTLEAGAMSGKGKAQEILDSGISNVGDVANAMNFFEKAHKRRGNGGDFSSNSDIVGLTQSMVERDRRKQDEGYEKQFASKEFLDQKMKDLQNATKPDASEPVEYQESDEYAGAKQRLNDGTYDTTSSMFKSGVVAENPTTAFRDANDAAPAADDRAKATSSYLEQYKEDMVKGGRIGEAKSQNLANAFNTVIGSDI